jgi:hypothetical protein
VSFSELENDTLNQAELKMSKVPIISGYEIPPEITEHKKTGHMPTYIKFLSSDRHKHAVVLNM